MVHLPDATDFIHSPRPRRHVDSPRLWTAAIAGSIGAHLLLLAFTVPLIMRVAAPQASSAPVPIELVDLNTTGAPASDPAQTPNPTAIAAPNSTPFSSDPSSPTEATDSPPPTDQAPTDQTSVLPPPNSESPPASPENPRGTVDNAPSPDPPDTPTPAPTSSTSGDSANSDSPEEANPNPPAPSSSTTPTQSPGNPSDSQPNPSNTNGGPDLPGIPISQTVVPTSLTASVTASTVPASENPRDIPEQNAVPLVQSQEFISDPLQSTCTVTPDIIRYLGQSVSMRVEIDAQGQVAEIFLRDPLPDSQDYADLAQCLIKTWEFEPARSGEQAVYSDNLIVSITINQ